MSSKAPRNTRTKQSKTVQIAGKILRGNRFLEIVRNSSHRAVLRLLYWTAGQAKVAPSFEIGRTIFKPVSGRPGELRATRIPLLPLPPCLTGSKLLSSLSAIFCSELALPNALAERSSLYCMSTWVADALGFQPPAFVTGPDPHEGFRFLQLLHALCRHPVLLCGTGATAVHTLSPLFETLLMFRPELGPKSLRNLLACSNYPGIYLPDTNGVHEVCRSKAVFVLDDAGEDDYFQGECVRLCLDGRSSYAALKPQRIGEIAAKFQPRLLAYRLANWEKVHNAEISPPSFSAAIRNVATAMAACAIGDEQLQQRIISLFAEDDEDERARQSTNPRTATIDVLLAAVHKGEEKITMQDLASKVNSLLRDRGEFCEYNPMEVGWKLRSLSLVRRHRSRGKTLFLGSDESRRIHEIAKSLGISEFHKPKRTCAWCKQLEVIVNTSVM